MTTSTTTLTWSDLTAAYADTILKLNEMARETRVIQDGTSVAFEELKGRVKAAVNNAANIGLVKVSEAMDDAIDAGKLLAYGI